MTARLDLAVAVPRERAGIDLIPEIGRDRTAIAMARVGRISETARRRALGLPLYEVPASTPLTKISQNLTGPDYSATPKSVQIVERPMAPTTPIATPPTDRPAVVRRPDPPPQWHICAQCGDKFIPNAGRLQRYCDPICKQAMENSKRRVGDARGPYARPDLRRDFTAVIQAVSAAWSVPPGDVIGPGRTKRVTYPRMAGYALLLELRADASTNDIGRRFGRDHTSIISGLRAHERRMEDEGYAAQYRRAQELAAGGAVNPFARTGAPADVVLPEVGDGG